MSDMVLKLWVKYRSATCPLYPYDKRGQLNLLKGKTMKLSGKVAIITGATGDIGKATAKKFVAEGAKVMLAGRSLEKLARLQEELNMGDSVHKLAGDIS